MIIDIIPVVTTKTCKKVDISFLTSRFQPPYTAMVVFEIEGDGGDSDNSLPSNKIKYVDIPQDIYAQWGTDDSFIIDYVLEQCGLEKAS